MISFAWQGSAGLTFGDGSKYFDVFRILPLYDGGQFLRGCESSALYLVSISDLLIGGKGSGLL
jgi:hypothetical protein